MRYALLPVSLLLLTSCVDSIVDPSSARIASGRASDRLVSTTGIEIVDLGDLGGPFAFAAAINDQEQVVGLTSTLIDPYGVSAFLWSAGTMTQIGPWSLAAPQVQAVDINGLGAVTGTVGNGIDGQAFVWNGAVTVLPNVEVGGYGQAYAINDAGTVVGSMSNAARNQIRAVAWQGGSPQLLPLLAGTNGGTARAINGDGWIIGETWDNTLNYRVTLWRGAETVDLGVFGTGNAINSDGVVVGRSSALPYILKNGSLTFLASPNTYGDARGINDAGVAVGDALFPDFTNRPVMWLADGTLVELGMLPGHTSGTAVDINSDGTIVGYTSGDGIFPRAVLWRPNAVADDPASLFQALGEKLATLGAAATPLKHTFDAASKQFGRGNSAAAAGSLGALRNQLQVFARRGVVSAADAAMMTTQIDAILALLGR